MVGMEMESSPDSEENTKDDDELRKLVNEQSSEILALRAKLSATEDEVTTTKNELRKQLAGWRYERLTQTQHKFFCNLSTPRFAFRFAPGPAIASLVM